MKLRVNFKIKGDFEESVARVVRIIGFKQYNSHSAAMNFLKSPFVKTTISCRSYIFGKMYFYYY